MIVASSLRSNMLIAIVLSGPIGRPGMIRRALRPEPERTFVASDRMARIDVTLTLRTAALDASIGRRADLKGMPREGPDSAR